MKKLWKKHGKKVLIDSLVFGLENLEQDYKDFISIEFQEV